MRPLENTLVGLAVGGACAWLSFVTCWWAAALVHRYVGGVSENMVAGAALTGLLLGLGLDAVFLRKWIRGFYSARLWLLALFYSALCVLAVASFMGLPVGTLGLGLLAGVYAGRRQAHQPSADRPAHGLRRVAVFAAVMTAGTALPIGLLALHDPSTAESLQRFTGIDSGGAGIAWVGLLCAVLFAAQYWGSLAAGRWALRLDHRTSLPGGAASS